MVVYLVIFLFFLSLDLVYVSMGVGQGGWRKGKLSPIFSLQNYNPCPSTCSILFFFLGAYLLTYLRFLSFVYLSTSPLPPCIPNQFTLTNSVYPVLVIIAYYLVSLPQNV